LYQKRWKVDQGLKRLRLSPSF